MRRPQAAPDADPGLDRDARPDAPADPSPSDEVFGRVDRLAAEFLGRLRCGERPTVDEYLARHPDLAPAIRELFPALVMVEDLKPDSDETIGPPAGPRSPADDRPPDRIGDYRILREVGRGGMGVVYEAEEERLGRRVALKVLAPWAVASDHLLRRFHREARSAAQLHHTNIVPVLGIGSDAGRAFYTMQFIHGVGLHQVLDEIRALEGKGGADLYPADSFAGPGDVTVVGGSARPLLRDPPPPLRRHRAHPGRVDPSAIDSGARYARGVARIGLQVAEALSHAHELGTLHRDIKPANILLDAHGDAWVTDFGLAKAVDDEDLTRTGDLVGTLRYMAPERFRGSCDARADVYGLGLTLYELLSRAPAFVEADRHALMRQIALADPPRLGSITVGVPRDLATIIHKAIEKDPGDRYRSAAALADDLRSFLDDRPIAARRAGPLERLARWSRRNPGLAALGAAVAVLLVAIAAISATSAYRLKESHAEVERRLWDAYLARARASRRSGSEGQRFDALDALSKAASLDAFVDRRGELRDEAIACLALADLRRVDVRRIPRLASRDRRLAFSPDGRRVAIGDESGAVRVLDPGQGGRPPLVMPGPGLPVVLLEFDTSGRRLAAKYQGGGSIRVRAFDLDGGAVLLDEPVPAYDAALGFDPPGRRLALGLEDGTVRIFDLDGGRPPASLPGPPEPYALRFDPAGRRIAVASTRSGRSLEVLRADGTGSVGPWSLPYGGQSLAWTPDGEGLAVGGGFRELYLLDPGDPEAPPRILPGHKGAIISVDFSHRGHLLASASWDGTVRLWHPESGEPLVVASSPEHWAVRFGPDDRTLSGSRDGESIWRWEVADGDEARGRFLDLDPDSRAYTVDLFPDGSTFASGGSVGVRIFDRGLRQVALLPAPAPASAEVLPDGRSLLTGGPSGILRWAIEPDGESIGFGPPEPFGPLRGRRVGRIRADGSGRRIAAVIVGSPPEVALFDAAPGPGTDGGLVLIQDHPRVERIDLNPDGSLLATGTWKGEGVRVWDASTGAPVAVLDVDGSAEVAFNPDGRSLLTGSGRAYVCWGVGTWEPRWRVPRREASNQPGKVAFAPDGSIVAVALTRTVARLLDARTGEALATFEPPSPDHLSELGLTRDLRFLYAKDHGGGTRRWDLRAIRGHLDATGIGWPGFPRPSPIAPADVPIPRPPD
ncbi:WD40 repeat domain-containing serine/threonine protein kinase [Tautonia plasticadhaerens]|uniref:Serine/threonine-protein kinase PrkC n=1 Tax=Tautonia plasticadhaerens TaxID=2527974 RepID=A0A518GVN8_9BACT|nr:serine/threonine-protein kinase [Tautonia plasticadhaerens]QDV32662.1 Serine/threonine-protein kinase PrkC [Tautonia plasticadhaerens]